MKNFFRFKHFLRGEKKLRIQCFQKKTFFRNLCVFCFFVFLSKATAQKTYDETAFLFSQSEVDWIQKKFMSKIFLDMEKVGFSMPSEKISAISYIDSRLVNLIKDPLFTLCVDSSYALGDYVLNREINLESLIEIIDGGAKTLGYFDGETFLFKTRHNLELPQIASFFVKHSEPYSPKKSIETTASRPYTGIIIDARGLLQVHGEFVEERAKPCFFPKIWNEKMEIVYERNIMESELEKKIGECAYHWSDDESLYKDRIGSDPLRIKAQKIFGRNRTDLLVRNEDALKIFSVPQNSKLLRQGKIVILLEKDLLVYNVAAPVKDAPYYTALQNAKLYPLKTPGADKIEETENAIRFTYNLKFIADSPALLPEEFSRITELAALLKQALEENAFTIFVAGHTADIGQHENQMALSIERTQTIIRLLIGQGISANLFTYRGYGETRPIGDNSTAKGRAENRRVEIELRPRTTYIQRSW